MNLSKWGQTPFAQFFLKLFPKRGLTPFAWNQVVVGAVITAGLVFGYWFGSYIATSSGEGLTNPLLNYLVRRSIQVPGAKEDGSFVLGDFETGAAIAAWEMDRSKLEVDQANAKEGSGAARVSFFSNVKLSEIALRKYFTSRGANFNWSEYRSLSVYIFNPQGEEKRILFQLSDAKRRLYKQDLVIKGDTGQTFEIPLERVGNEINLKKIREIAFFAWNTQTGFTLYFDEIKLVK